MLSWFDALDAAFDATVMILVIVKKGDEIL